MIAFTERGDSRNIVRGCSWLSLLCLLMWFDVRQCSRLFGDGCRRSCQLSCQASSNDSARGFELPAPCLWLFVVAFCGLQLRVHCLYLRSIVSLNMPALLHRCYM